MNPDQIRRGQVLWMSRTDKADDPKVFSVDVVSAGPIRCSVRMSVEFGSGYPEWRMHRGALARIAFETQTEAVADARDKLHRAVDVAHETVRRAYVGIRLLESM